MSRSLINDFVEKLSNVEGRFELYVSFFLKYKNQFVFALKDSKDWLFENGKRKASLSAFRGKLEEGVSPTLFLKDRYSKELGVNIDIDDSTNTYIDYHHKLKKLPINSVKGEFRPQMITIAQQERHSSIPNSVIFSYAAHSKNKPHSIQHSALFFAKEVVLVQMFKNEKTARELKKAGAVFEERIKIPDNLYLYSTGSLNSLLRYISYEVF